MFIDKSTKFAILFAIIVDLLETIRVILDEYNSKEAEDKYLGK